MSAARPRTVEVSLPEEAFQSLPWEPEALAQKLRVLFLVDLVRQRRLGHGKAAELAGMRLLDFVRVMGQQGVSVFDYDPGELEAEVASGS